MIGESLLRLKSSEFLFNKIKEFLSKNSKISDEWNSLNILSTDAATVGNIDLGIINNENNLINDLKEHKFDIVYLVGQDNLEFDKKDELESSMFNYLNLQKEKQVDDQNNSSKEFQNENLTIKVKDYYFSNVIARSSKTMVECNNSKLNLKSTGTEG